MSFKESVIVPIELYEKYFPKNQVFNKDSEITARSPTAKPLRSKAKSNKKLKNKTLQDKTTKEDKKHFEWLIFENNRKKKAKK